MRTNYVKGARMESRIIAKLVLGLPLTRQEYAYFILYMGGKI